jgi:hypothetical protein
MQAGPAGNFAHTQKSTIITGRAVAGRRLERPEYLHNVLAGVFVEFFRHAIISGRKDISALCVVRHAQPKGFKHSSRL